MTMFSIRKSTPVRHASQRPVAKTALAGMAALLALSGCAPTGANTLPREALNAAIGQSIGDPNTCVLLADRATGRVMYRYGAPSTCSAAWPACDRPGTLTTGATIALGTTATRTVSCESSPGRRVGWAAGPAPGERPMTYAAVMEGDRALPGREIAARLDGALRRAGL